MTADRMDDLTPRPVGGVGSESRFLEKTKEYTGSEKQLKTIRDSNPYKQGGIEKEVSQSGAIFGPRQGYFSRKLEKFRERARANVSAAKRHAWSVVSANPFINTRRRRYVYKVRNGELTVTNQKGEIITRQKDVRLEKYNGITLKGEQSDRKKLTIKGGMKDRVKLSFLEGAFGGVKDRHEKTIKYRRKTGIEGVALGVGSAFDYVLSLPKRGYKSSLKLGKAGAKHTFNGSKASIKYGSDGVKSGFRKGKVFVNQYREGEGIFSYRSEDTKQHDIDGDVLEVGQTRGRR